MSVDLPWSHQTELVAEPSSVSHARAFVVGHLLDHELPDLVDDIQLVVSELTTNALLHARTPFIVTLGASMETVLLEVLDEELAGPVLVVADPSASCGRGLAIVQALSRRWGVSTRGANGKTVWAEFDTHRSYDR